MHDLTLVDSGGSRIPQKTVCAVACRADGVAVIPQTEVAGEEHWAYADVRQLEIGGPGAVRRNAGMWGFGVVGIAAATAVNRATTKTTINTNVHLVTSTAEYMFLSHVYGVQALQTSLAPVFTRMRAAADSPSAAPSAALSDELTNLARLHESGALSDDEFQQAKAKLLQDHR
jgi:hypothetical protein